MFLYAIYHWQCATWMIGTACPITHVGCAGLSPMLLLAASILNSPQACWVPGWLLFEGTFKENSLGTSMASPDNLIYWAEAFLSPSCSITHRSDLRVSCFGVWCIIPFKFCVFLWSLGQDALSNYTFLKHFSIHIFAVHWFQAPFACKIMSQVRRKGSPR